MPIAAVCVATGAALLAAARSVPLPVSSVTPLGAPRTSSLPLLAAPLPAADPSPAAVMAPRQACAAAAPRERERRVQLCGTSGCTVVPAECASARAPPPDAPRAPCARGLLAGVMATAVASNTVFVRNLPYDVTDEQARCPAQRARRLALTAPVRRAARVPIHGRGAGAQVLRRKGQGCVTCVARASRLDGALILLTRIARAACAAADASGPATASSRGFGFVQLCGWCRLARLLSVP